MRRNHVLGLKPDSYPGNEVFLTIFTPTYNRKRRLTTLYQSLLEQEMDCFEWLIIDDGSTDGTQEYVNELLDEGAIPIRYCWQENSGNPLRDKNRGLKGQL